MSLQAITAALALRGFSSSEKLLLIAWANYADENGKCYPSQKRLAEDTGLSDRQIRTIAASLAERGLIHRLERRRPDGSRSTDLVTLVCLQQAEVTSGGVRKSLPGGAEVTSGQNLSLEPSKALKEPKEPSRFDDFWKAYPLKVGRKDAQTAYTKALRKIDHDRLCAARDAQIGCGVWLDGFGPHAATWLNGERWTDERRPDCNRRTGPGSSAGSNSSGNRPQAVGMAGILRRQRESEGAMDVPPEWQTLPPF